MKYNYIFFLNCFLLHTLVSLFHFLLCMLGFSFSHLGGLYIYNSKRLQHSLSNTCAQWCIYYIWRKCQGWSLRNILKPFYSKDFLINDHMLNLVVNNNFKINRKVIDKEFVKIQIARKTAEKNMHS